VSTCLVCLEDGAPDSPEAPYHPPCLEDLFGVPRLPRVSFDGAAIPAKVAHAVGKFSISGVQPKAQTQLTQDRAALEIVPQGGRYLLKPDVLAYPCLPANEHVTMALAKRCGLLVPAHGLIKLTDSSLAYVVRRFDRTDDNPANKLVQEDFCSLAALRSGDKYEGSAELCGRLVRQHVADPEASARRLFLQLCFSYWVGNGDLHLKNLSLIERDDRLYTLSPAYDLISTWIYGGRELALPVSGKKRTVTRSNWLEFAERHAGIPHAEAQAILDGMLSRREAAVALIERSAIADPALRQRFQELLAERAQALSGRAGDLPG
jgi:serine/threonine-protein kinase HipA